MSDELMQRRNWTRQHLIEDEWMQDNDMTQLKGLFVFTPTDIVTLKGTPSNTKIVKNLN